MIKMNCFNNVKNYFYTKLKLLNLKYTERKKKLINVLF